MPKEHVQLVKEPDGASYLLCLDCLAEIENTIDLLVEGK